MQERHKKESLEELTTRRTRRAGSCYENYFTDNVQGQTVRRIRPLIKQIDLLLYTFEERESKARSETAAMELEERVAQLEEERDAMRRQCAERLRKEDQETDICHLCVRTGRQ